MTTLSTDDCAALRIWLDRICLKGEDDCLPLFLDWALEQGLEPADAIRDECQNKRQLVRDAVWFLTNNQHRKFKELQKLDGEVRDALNGKPCRPNVPRAIRNSRMTFRKILLSQLGPMVVGENVDTAEQWSAVSSRSNPPWVPVWVQQEVPIPGKLSAVPWRFVGHTDQRRLIAVCGCGKEKTALAFDSDGNMIPSIGTLFLHVELPHSLRYRIGDIDQRWLFGQCSSCMTVFWATDKEQALENTPQMLEGM